MAIITKPPGPSAHWYRSDGTPCHRQPIAAGDGTRPTHLGDARKQGLYPSVSGIIGMLDKPGLNKWKVNQAILAALKTARVKEESDSHLCDRVRDAAYQQVDDAAELGTAIHFEIERFLKFDQSKGATFIPDPKLSDYVRPVINWMYRQGIKIESAEKVLVNPDHGYAGTCDAPYRAAKSFGILDYKSRKTTPGEDVVPWPEQALQIAAYFVAHWGEPALDHPMAWGGNVFTSTTEKGRVVVAMYDRHLLKLAWHVFRDLCGIWRFFNQYDPRAGVTGQPAWPQAKIITVSEPGSLDLASAAPPSQPPPPPPLPVPPPAGAPIPSVPASTSAPTSGPSSAATSSTTSSHEPAGGAAQPTMLEFTAGFVTDNVSDGIEFLGLADCAAFTPGKIKTIYMWYYHQMLKQCKVGLRNDGMLVEHGWRSMFFAYPKDLDNVDKAEGKTPPKTGTNGLPVKPAKSTVPPGPTITKDDLKLSTAEAKAASKRRLAELEAMPMSFGKHAKETLEKVPGGYLVWLMGQMNKAGNKIPEHVKEYLTRPDVIKAIDKEGE